MARPGDSPPEKDQRHLPAVASHRRPLPCASSRCRSKCCCGHHRRLRGLPHRCLLHRLHVCPGHHQRVRWDQRSALRCCVP
eukprot:3716615-Alexandrium_andersonii.AAC.1